MMSSNPNQTRDENPLRVAIREEQISVAPGNAVQIQAAVINDGPIEEDVNILVKGVPANWVTIDTPVAHLLPGQARQVTLTVQPPPVPEGRVGQYSLDIQAISQNDSNHSAIARSLLTVAAYESRGRIGVMLGSVHFSAIPGSTIHIPILLQNRGLQEDSFRLNIAGIPSNWISTNSALTRLEPSANKEIMVTVHVPRSPLAGAGRTPFVIQFLSLVFPDQKTEVDCILTISAFSQFSATLEPATLVGEQFGQVIINNEGNTVDAYSLSFHSPGNLLMFEKAVQVRKAGAQPGTQEVQIAYVDISQGDTFQVAAGERGLYPFRTRPRSRPLVGGEQTYPFTIRVASTEKRVHDLSGQLSEKGYVPLWLLPATMLAALMACFLLLLPFRNLPTAARATQTAAFNQTQAALAGGQDTDGDGLTDTEESGFGTDPLVADTDADELLDGEEVETYQTNPLLADTDGDGLKDGEEVKQYMTDPRNPDTDADLLNDGDEIEAKTDPKVADTDQDGLSDGAEASLGTDPHQQDTDRDQLLDSQENQTCPKPLTPDSDADGIIDGNDRDPCNASNPALTATAIAGAPTQAQPTQPQPTLPPPTVVVPTSTLPPTITFVPPTNPPVATLTPAPPSLQGVMIFGTNRDGNSEIYALNLANQSLTRLTSNSAQDVQPALAPDSVQMAYVSNQDGNNEIYLGGLDRRVPLNLTNHAADDQQPTWSPDGNWIAFTTNRDGNQEIYIMRSDGSQVRNLTNNLANDFAPTWFSVGGLFGSEDWIAFTSTRDGNQEIYKVRPDGTGLTNLTNNLANDYSPAGFPGGQILAFVTERDGNPEIYTMNPNGGAATNITNNPARDLDPAVGSGGNWIAFSTEREGNLEIYVVRTQGGTAYNLSRSPGQDRDPDW
jgi:Tol biopolymer transport system component